MSSTQANASADLSLIERLAAIPYTGAVTDILDEMGYRRQTLPHSIQSLVLGQTLAGRALTLLGEPSEVDDPEVIFPPFLKMLGEIRSGDVLTTQANDNVSAHLGELSSETASFAEPGRGNRRRRARYRVYVPLGVSGIRPLQDAGRHSRPLAVGGLEHSHRDRLGLHRPWRFDSRRPGRGGGHSTGDCGRGGFQGGRSGADGEPGSCGDSRRSLALEAYQRFGRF